MKDKLILIITVLYLVITRVFFLAGPIQWGDKIDYTRLFLLLSAFDIAIIIGYLFGLKHHLVFGAAESTEKINKNNNLTQLNKIIVILLIISIISNFIYIMSKNNSISVIDNAKSIINGIINPSANYNSKINTGNSAFYNIYSPLYSLLSVSTFFVIPLGLYYFSKLELKTKIMIAICVVVEISRWLVVGTNKGIIDIIIIAVFVYILKRIKSNNVNNIDSKERKRKRVFLTTGILIAILLGFSFFYKNINSRLLNNHENILYSINSAKIKNNYALCKSEKICSLLIYSQSYITQGYYGMGLAMNEKFEPMYGIGSSIFLTEKIKAIAPESFTNRSYIKKVEKYGWSSKLNWHTIFTWLANDYSFVGVIFIMLLFGYIASKITYYSRSGDKWYYAPLFTTLGIVIFYLPMNNQIVSNPRQFLGTAILCVIVLLDILKKRKKRNDTPTKDKKCIIKNN